MKKILSLLACTCLFAACTTVQQAQHLQKCTYALKSVELSDYNLTSFNFVVTITITNPSKTETAKLKRFEGLLTANEEKMADVTLSDIEVPPASSYNAKAKINVPMATFGSKMLGLISMGSGTVDYHLKGVMYFEGPLGIEVPIPVDMGRIGNYN